MPSQNDRRENSGVERATPFMAPQRARRQALARSVGETWAYEIRVCPRKTTVGKPGESEAAAVEVGLQVAVAAGRWGAGVGPRVAGEKNEVDGGGVRATAITAPSVAPRGLLRPVPRHPPSAAAGRRLSHMGGAGEINNAGGRILISILHTRPQRAIVIPPARRPRMVAPPWLCLRDAPAAGGGAVLPRGRPTRAQPEVDFTLGVAVVAAGEAGAEVVAAAEAGVEAAAVTIRTVRLRRGRGPGPARPGPARPGPGPRCALQTLIPSALLWVLPEAAASAVEAVAMAAGRWARGWGGTVRRRGKGEQRWRRQ